MMFTRSRMYCLCSLTLTLVLALAAVTLAWAWWKDKRLAQKAEDRRGYEAGKAAYRKFREYYPSTNEEENDDTR